MASAKIVKQDKAIVPTELEMQIANALTEMEVSTANDLRADLKDFLLSGAREVEVQGGKKNAIVIFTPYKVWRSITQKKIVGRLIRELEKKFQKKHVLIVGNRTILDKNFRRKGIQVRPRSRTLTAVHEGILEDVVAPSEIVGKRQRVSSDGSKLLKIFLDKKDKEQVEEKLAVFSAVYRGLTNKDAEFSCAA